MEKSIFRGLWRSRIVGIIRAGIRKRQEWKHEVTIPETVDATMVSEDGKTELILFRESGSARFFR